VRIVLDTTVLVRASASSHGLARDLLLAIITGKHSLILSNEMLHELAMVLRYPRLMALHGLPENLIYDFS
jgi:predicted nucleic acid-binding protein